jgi:hypothetical protein
VSLNRRQQCATLWTVGWVFLLGSMGLCALILTRPIAMANPVGASNQAGTTGVTSLGKEPDLRLADFQAVLNMDLRRSLYDAPPQTVTEAPVRAAQPFRARLIAITLESDQNNGNKAMLVDAAGAYQHCHVGDTIDQAIIRSIEPYRVILDYLGQEVILSIDQGAKY